MLMSLYYIACLATGIYTIYRIGTSAIRWRNASDWFRGGEWLIGLMAVCVGTIGLFGIINIVMGK